MSAPRPEPRQPIDLHVPFATLLKIALGIGLVFAVWELRIFIAVLLFALLGAATLQPVVARLERRMRHGFAVLSVGIALVAATIIFWALILPPLTEQISVFISHFDQVSHKLVARTEGTGFLHSALVEARNWPRTQAAKQFFARSWTLGLALIDGLTGIILLLILTLYLLQDGARIYAWLLSYVPRAQRNRMAETVPQVSRVVRAYVRGQVITSVICGLYSFAALSLLHVPAALPLAVLAAICDILPVLGIIVSGVPAALLALTVSPSAALATVGLYLLYHGIENYLLVPRIYGKELRLSTLTVLIALIVGGTLFGVLGAILVLPIVAAYPIVERLWLGGYLGGDTIAEHVALDAPDDADAARAAKRVIDDSASPNERH